MIDQRLETVRMFSRWLKADLADFLIKHGTVYPNRVGLLKWSKQDLINSATDYEMRKWTTRDEMAVAMSRETDPTTDEGYGPRAVND